MRKSRCLFVLVLCTTILCLSGCEDASNYKVITCNKKATLSDVNTTANLKYEIYYEGDDVKKTISIEKITSDSEKILKKYQSSYKKVFSKYKDIKHYNNTVTKNNNTVISKTVIDYTKVDTSKILEVEGENGSIYTKDGKVKLNTLLEFYKKYGSQCDD